MIDPVRGQAPPVDWGVTIDTAAIDDFVHAFTVPVETSFDYQGLPSGLSSAEWWDYLVPAVSCIACLWAPDGAETWSTEYRGEWLEDAPGYFAAFTRVQEAGELTLARVAQWDLEDVRALFAGRGVLQLLGDRRERLVGVARAGLDRWDGTFANLVEEAGFDGPTVARLLVETVPGYRDEVETEHGILRFWKLAHLATAMMAKSGPGFARLESFPVYPDYMVPRTLRHHGVLRYAPDLAQAVDTRQPVPAGSHWELAIRWSSMRAAELVLGALSSAGKTVTMPDLDYALWHASVLGPDAGGMGEHHRTVTMAY